MRATPAFIVGALGTAIFAIVLYVALPRPPVAKTLLQHLNLGAKLQNSYDESTHEDPDILGENLPEALCEYQRALIISPTNKEALEGIGNCYFRICAYKAGPEQKELAEDSLFYLRKALDLISEPDRKAYMYFNMTEAYLILGQTAEARSAANNAVKFDKKLYGPILFDGDRLLGYIYRK